MIKSWYFYCTDHCPAPRRCCTSCQHCTSAGSGWRRCSRSCLGSCAARWAPGSGADQHSRQSCRVCLKTWLGKTHKAVVTLILFMHLGPYDHNMNMMENMWFYWFSCPLVRCICIALKTYLWCCLYHSYVYLLFSCHPVKQKMENCSCFFCKYNVKPCIMQYIF